MVIGKRGEGGREEGITQDYHALFNIGLYNIE